jgi:hypothetical protein
VTFRLWANGSVFSGTNSEVVADVPVGVGETVMYVEMKVPAGASIAFHVPFTIEASLP